MNIRIVTSDPLTILHDKKKKLIAVLLSDVIKIDNDKELSDRELFDQVVDSDEIKNLSITKQATPYSVEEINDDIFKDISCVNASSFKILVFECKIKPVRVCLDYAYEMRKKKGAENA